MSFTNPIVAGTKLVRDAVQSPNYTPGSAGWSINRDGTAEFQNATVRGSVQLGGTPPAASVTIGGTVPAELVTYYAAGAPETQTAPETVVALIWQANDGQGNYTYQAVVVDSTAPDKLSCLVQGRVIAGTVAEFFRVVLNPNVGAFANSLTDFYNNPVFLESNSVDTDVLTCGLPGDTVGRLVADAGGRFYFGTGPSVDCFLGRAGSQQLVVDKLIANTAAAGAVGVAETWHAMTLQNSWVNSGGTDPTAQYRLVPSPANCVQVVGSIKNGVKTSGTVIATLPVGYRPATHKVLFPIAIDTVSGTTFPRMTLNTDGTLTIDNCAAATFIFFNAVIPLDA